jgi:riboflavin kinase/FMN adenylyltransferase
VPYQAAVSIGSMPTFGDGMQQIEAHLIGFDGDLYGRTVQLQLLDWLRDQQRFPGVEALQAQLSRDVARAAVSV